MPVAGSCNLRLHGTEAAVGWKKGFDGPPAASYT